MKIRVLAAFAVCWVALVAAYAESDKETGLPGKWATDAVWNAKPDVKTGGALDSILKSAGGMATQSVPGVGSRGSGGGMRTNGMNGSRGPQIDMTGSKVVERGSSEGLALTMEFKLDKTKLTGKITEVVSGNKFDIEEATLMGTKFQFTTYKKVSNVKVATVYKGELTDESTITITRWTNSGKPADLKEDGSQEPLIFKRVK